MKSIAFIFGTRPEAIKCAPVILAMREDHRFYPVVLSTGQHRQMLDEVLEAFGISPETDLRVMSSPQSLTQVTHRILAGLSEYDAVLHPDAIVVHGDTASTLAGALYGFHRRIPVVHLEAGLRSGDVKSPFPEEANRRIVAHLSSLHLAPTMGNMQNLLKEGFDPESIVVTGNTVVDALFWGVKNSTGYGDPQLDDLDNERRRVIVASAHRRESWGKLDEIAQALVEIVERHDVRIIVPLHRNPIVREAMLPILSGREAVTIIDPLPYPNFCRLLQRCDLVLSDSSGAEEEGPALNKPTLVLREISERREAISAGSARLVSRDRARIVREVSYLLSNAGAYDAMRRVPCPYGDGMATPRVLEAVARLLGASGGLDEVDSDSPLMQVGTLAAITDQGRSVPAGT